jgi:hypothetical protein
MKTYSLSIATSVIAGIGPYFSFTQPQFSEPFRMVLWGFGLLVLGSGIRLGRAVREKKMSAAGSVPV